MMKELSAAIARRLIFEKHCLSLSIFDTWHEQWKMYAKIIEYYAICYKIKNRKLIKCCQFISTVDVKIKFESFGAIPISMLALSIEIW